MEKRVVEFRVPGNTKGLKGLYIQGNRGREKQLSTFICQYFLLLSI